MSWIESLELHGMHDNLFFVLFMVWCFLICGCSKEMNDAGREPFIEGKTLVCPSNTHRAEVTNTSYPEYFCVGMEGRVGTWLEFDVNGRLRTKAEYNHDKLNGPWFHYHPNGAVETQGQMQDDMRVGEWKQFYVNGAIRSIKNYKANHQSGNIQLFYQAGGLMAEGAFLDDYEDGPWKVYTPEGKLARECNMVHGEEKDCVIHIKDFQVSTYSYASKERGAL